MPFKITTPPLCDSPNPEPKIVTWLPIDPVVADSLVITGGRVQNFLQQRAKFDDFIEVFNNERPHEALDMKCPAEVYQPSPRPYTGLPDTDYPLHDKTIVVTRWGRICLGRKKITLNL